MLTKHLVSAMHSVIFGVVTRPVNLQSLGISCITQLSFTVAVSSAVLKPFARLWEALCCRHLPLDLHEISKMAVVNFFLVLFTVKWVNFGLALDAAWRRVLWEAATGPGGNWIRTGWPSQVVDAATMCSCCHLECSGPGCELARCIWRCSLTSSVIVTSIAANANSADLTCCSFTQRLSGIRTNSFGNSMHFNRLTDPTLTVQNCGSCHLLQIFHY